MERPFSIEHRRKRKEKETTCGQAPVGGSNHHQWLFAAPSGLSKSPLFGTCFQLRQTRRLPTRSRGCLLVHNRKDILSRRQKTCWKHSVCPISFLTHASKIGIERQNHVCADKSPGFLAPFSLLCGTPLTDSPSLQTLSRHGTHQPNCSQIDLPPDCQPKALLNHPEVVEHKFSPTQCPLG
jgi:hypothetical protein